jgi:hypothetical protein
VRIGKALLVAVVTLAGCVDGFIGSNLQLDLSAATPVQASVGATPRADELASDVHFTLYAFQDDPMVGRLFEIQRFEVHRVVDLQSPCFIDVGDHVPHPGLHVSQYAARIAQDTGIADLANPPPGATQQQQIDAATAVQRQLNVTALASDAGPKAITSVSAHAYPPVGAACADPSGIPPSTCTDDTSNQRRLAICQAAWHNDPDYFEGTDRILTSPLAGTTHGFVDGTNPINLAPIGGAQFFVDEELAGFTGFALYWQADTTTDPPPGTLLMFGKPTTPTRGVIHVHLTSAQSPALTGDLAIFSNLDADSTQF